MEMLTETQIQMSSLNKVLPVSQSTAFIRRDGEAAIIWKLLRSDPFEPTIETITWLEPG